MEAINHECYVSFEVVKLLKEAGFDWECEYEYSEYIEDEIHEISFVNKQLRIDFGSYDDYNKYYSAPTLDVAQRWLREVKNIYVESVLCVNRGTFGYSYGFSIIKVSVDLSIAKTLYPLTYFDEEETKGFIKYELSLEEGTKKALEIILEKGE